MYTVEDISEMTGKHPETVRRWIRSGRLVAEDGCGGRGNRLVISEESYQKFLEDIKKKRVQKSKIIYENHIPQTRIELLMELAEILRMEDVLRQRKRHIGELLKRLE